MDKAMSHGCIEVGNGEFYEVYTSDCELCFLVSHDEEFDEEKTDLGEVPEGFWKDRFFLRCDGSGETNMDSDMLAKVKELVYG